MSKDVNKVDTISAVKHNLLEQLRIFSEVASVGSFSAAAKKIGKAPSAVTYAIQTLENYYGQTLFDRSAYRPSITEAGRTLYEDAQIIFRSLDRLQSRMHSYDQDVAPDISIVYDAHIPASKIAHCVLQLSTEFPFLNFNISRSYSANIIETAELEQADFILTVIDDHTQVNGYDGREIGAITKVAVAAMKHPLAALRTVGNEQLDQHTQLLFDVNPPEPGKESVNTFVTSRWSTDDLFMFRELIKGGAAWAIVEKEMVQDLLKDGTLVELDLASAKEIFVRLTVGWPVRKKKGDIHNRFVQLLESVF